MVYSMRGVNICNPEGIFRNRFACTLALTLDFLIMTHFYALKLAFYLQICGAGRGSMVKIRARYIHTIYVEACRGTAKEKDLSLDY